MSEEKSPSGQLAAIAAINRALDTLSNKEAKEVLTMVCSIRNLRVVSMDRPIGLPLQSAPPKTVTQVSSRKATPKATWKSDPRWGEIDKRHSTLVEQIKHDSDTTVKETHIEDLRKLELDMKSLKQQLRGFHESA
jgi:transaldolase